MNEFEIIGFRRSQGTSKKTNKPYSGYIIFYTYVIQDVSGKGCDNSFVSDDILGGYVPEIGDRFRLFYNKTGFMTDFQLV